MGCGFVGHGLDVGGGEVVSGGVGDGAQLGFYGAWMGASGLAECLADPIGDGDTLASGEVPGFLGTPCRPGGLVGVFAWLKSSRLVELGSIRGIHPHAPQRVFDAGLLPSMGRDTPHPAHTSTGLSTSGPSPLDSGSGAGMTGKESTFTLVVPPTPLILRRGSRHRRIFDSTSGPTHPGSYSTARGPE